MLRRLTMWIVSAIVVLTISTERTNVWATNLAPKIEVNEDAMTYRVQQTVQSSFPELGPLQCESTCAIRSPSAVCNKKVPTCAYDCPRKCSIHDTKSSGFRYKICVEGCTQFCAFWQAENCQGC